MVDRRPRQVLSLSLSAWCFPRHCSLTLTLSPAGRVVSAASPVTADLSAATAAGQARPPPYPISPRVPFCSCALTRSPAGWVISAAFPVTADLSAATAAGQARSPPYPISPRVRSRSRALTLSPAGWVVSAAFVVTADLSAATAAGQARPPPYPIPIGLLNSRSTPAHVHPLWQAPIKRRGRPRRGMQVFHPPHPTPRTLFLRSSSAGGDSPLPFGLVV
jgi:hypothetical protein